MPNSSILKNTQKYTLMATACRDRPWDLTIVGHPSGDDHTLGCKNKCGHFHTSPCLGLKIILWYQVRQTWGHVPNHHASSMNRWSLQERMVLHNVGKDHSTAQKIIRVGYTQFQEEDGMSQMLTVCHDNFCTIATLSKFY